MVRRWRERLDKVRFLYRDRDGRLWGVPRLRSGEYPVDYVTRKPLNVKAWLIARLSEMHHAAEDFESEDDEQSVLRLSVHGAIETLIGEASQAALRKAVERFDGYHLGAKMPEQEEFYPRNWTQLEDERGNCEWLRDSDQKISTLLFLAQCGVEKPSKPGEWVELPKKART